MTAHVFSVKWPLIGRSRQVSLCMNMFMYLCLYSYFPKLHYLHLHLIVQWWETKTTVHVHVHDIVQSCTCTCVASPLSHLITPHMYMTVHVD